MSPASRRLVLLGSLVLLAFAGAWWFARVDEQPTSSRRPARPAVASRPATTHPVGAPRSANGLISSTREDVSVDVRPPDARRENLIREGLGTIQDLKFMHPQVFDAAAKRWGEDPRTKALVAEWKEVEAAWKTQDEATKAAQLPRMQAMWREALDLLRAEVEQSAREAGVK